MFLFFISHWIDFYSFYLVTPAMSEKAISSIFCDVRKEDLRIEVCDDLDITIRLIDGR